MARRSKTEKDDRIVSAIRKLVENSENQTTIIRNRWRENYDIFVYGTRTDEKFEWQTKFSVNKFQTSMRAAQGRLVNILVNTPDWFEVCPKGYGNANAEQLAPAIQKIMEYYLDAAKFKRHASQFFLCSLISQGVLHIGWQMRLIQNPEYVLKATEKQRQEVQRRLARNVENPHVADPMAMGDVEQSISDAIEKFVAEAQGLKAESPMPDKFIQVGCLEFLDVNPEKFFWDPNAAYMEESAWKAFKYTVNRWELNHRADLGFFSKEKVKKIGDARDSGARTASYDLRYKNTTGGPLASKDTVELLVYYGPLIIDGEVEQDKYFCIIANDSVLLKEGEYPYWEPPGHQTPICAAAVRPIPFRATGAGIGDNAAALQKVYDSNWQLICDTFRFGIAGINVVNWQNLVDKSQLLEGVYPGMTLEVRGDPKDNFMRVNLTNNIENQAMPVQNMFETAIDQLTGINELMVGGGNRYSRTAAAETEARLEAGAENVNTIAIDLEQNFLIPTLEKVLGRILQFGLDEIENNPELRGVLDENELRLITELTTQNRMEAMNQWFKFKIKGFSSAQDKTKGIQLDNELLSIINSGGPLSMLINLPEFMKQYFKNRDVKDPERLIVTDSPLVAITAENQALMSGHMVMPSQADDHQFHIQMQQPLAGAPYATPEMQQHVMMHQQALMQMQMAQQQQQGGMPPEEQGPIQ